MDDLPGYYCVIVQDQCRAKSFRGLRHTSVQDCIERNMTKEETMRFVENEYVIPIQDTNRVWDHLERTNPDLFIAYHARIRGRNARIPQRVARPSPPEVTSARRRKVRGTKKEYRLSPPPYCRPLLPDLNVPAASPQEAAAYANAVFPPTQAGPSRAANANAYPNDFWQRVMNTLGQIQSNTQHLDTLRHIQSNTEQVVKLLTGGGHGFGPHPSAAGSLKRQRAEEADERGRNEEAEKQQQKEEGNGEELQEKEEGNDEELQKNEGCDNV